MHPTHRAVSTGPGCSAGSLSVRLHLIPALAALVLFAAASPGLRAGNAPAPPPAPPTEATEPTGTVVIHVPRAGFLRFLGHSHRIEARNVSVAVDWPGGEAAPVSVSVEVPVDALEVTDGEPSEENRAKVREEMLGPKVLDAENHPAVRFVSSAITKVGSGGWRAAGTLTVRGVDRAVTLDVEPRPGEDGIFSASGRIELRPADYGIAPVTALGGTVRTADTIEIKFTARLSVTAAYVPPVEIFRRLRSEWAGVSLDYDAFARGALSCRVRAVAQWSRSRGDFTVAADVAGDPDPARNPFSAPEPSRDVFKSRTASAELELALRLPVERPVSAFVNAAYTFTDLVFQVDAVLEGGFHDTARISTSGGMRSYGAGFRAALTDRLHGTLSVVYVPLRVQRRPDAESRNDPLVQARAAIRFFF